MEQEGGMSEKQDWLLKAIKKEDWVTAEQLASNIRTEIKARLPKKKDIYSNCQTEFHCKINFTHEGYNQGVSDCEEVIG